MAENDDELITRNVIKLTSGAEYPAGHVKILYLFLRKLMDDEPVLFYELVKFCRDPSHPTFGETREALRQKNWLDLNNRPHEITKDIVKHYVVGEGVQMELLAFGGER